MEYTNRSVGKIENILNPLVDKGEAESVFALVGSFSRPGPVNTAFMFSRLVPWEERERSQQQIVRSIFPGLLSVPGVRAFAINPASLGQRGWGAPVQLILGGPSYDVLNKWADEIVERAGENPKLLNIDKDYSEKQPQIRVSIDRNRASDLGVSIETIGRTLESLMGSRTIGRFEKGGKQYDVIMRAEAEDRQTRNDLNRVYVRSETSDKFIPVSSFITLTETAGAAELKRTDRLRAVRVTASLGPDYTMAEALTYLEGLAEEVAGDQARVSYGGLSRTFKDSSAALLFTFVTAFLVVFLVLAAQFESFVHPIVIMTSVPLAVTGALGAMLMQGVTLNVYSQIGVIMLIGLTAKNAILIVEFANQLRDEGMEILEAVTEASVTRLRPVLMTTISTALGAVPLAMATGAGAESRETIGIVIMGGVLFSTVLSLGVVPVFYLLLARFTKRSGEISRKLDELDKTYQNT